jgi:hypothetical protein
MYPECAQIALKLDPFLRSLGVDPDGADGKNDPRADLILALVAEMSSPPVGYVAISNCLHGIITSTDADPLLRLCAVARMLHLLDHRIDPSDVRREPGRIEDCRWALFAAACHLVHPRMGVAHYTEEMDRVFGWQHHVTRAHPSLDYHGEQLRYQNINDESQLVLYTCGDYVASATCKTPEEARATLLEWKASNKCREPAYGYFLSRLEDLYRPS